MKFAAALAILGLSFATIAPVRAASDKAWRYCTVEIPGRGIGDTGLIYVSGDEFTAMTRAHEKAGHRLVFCNSYGDNKADGERSYNGSVVHHQGRGWYQGVLATPGAPQAKAQGDTTGGSLTEQARKAQPEVDREVRDQIAAALKSVGKPAGQPQTAAAAQHPASREAQPAAASAPAGNDSAPPATKPLRFVLYISMRNLPGDTHNSNCYSNIITRPGPPGWGAGGFQASGSASQANAVINGLKAQFIAKCRSASGRDITSEGNFGSVWNQHPADEARVDSTRPRFREDVSVSL